MEMARSPSDATRFTATGPYAASGSSFTPNASTAQGTQISFGSPAPSNETPQQKIARLRAAAAAAKRGQESQFDQVVRIGRRWADRAHRFTAIGLIGLTVVSGMVATAGITDMLLHNRRRRNEWLAQKQAETQIEVQRALVAHAEGRATDDQMLLINRERAAAEAAEARRNRAGIFKRAKNWMFSGLSTEEQKGGRIGAGAADALAVSHVIKEELPVEKDESSVVHSLEKAVESHRQVGEPTGIPKRLGGPLDQEAQRVAIAVSNTGEGWLNWLTGKR